MYKELQANAIVDNFISKLKSLKFIEESKRSEVELRLAVIADKYKKRHEVVNAAKWLWKVFIECSLRDITENMRGLIDICEYFDEYAEYEHILFALDDNHRDHVIHSIWVMLIGFYFKMKYPTFKVMKNSVIGTLSGEEGAQESKEDLVNMVREHDDSLWCLIALTHDLGYPIEKTKKANEKMGKMISNFGFLKQSDFSYDFSVIHQTAIESLLDNLSSVLMCVPGKMYNVIHYAGTRLDYSKSLERLDHGIMSAYLLQMYLDYICDNLIYIIGLPLEYGSKDKERAKNMAIILELLKAVASHTNVNIYGRDIGSLASLLLLSDELDEFSRYSHSETGGDWIRTMCRTELECTGKSVRFRYKFGEKEIRDKIEVFFGLKVRSLYQRFEVEKDKFEKISISCIDVRKASPIEWYFEKSLKYNEGTIVSPEGKRKGVREMLNDLKLAR